MGSWRWLTDAGGVATPRGFTAGAGTGGLKESGEPDVALVLADRDCSASGVFTRNRVVAAPVVLDRELLAADPSRLRAVTTNAGNANACTGDEGLRDARATQALTAELVGCEPAQVLVLSTGVIGVPLDMAALERGLRGAGEHLSSEGGAAAARAIMTTDTRPKEAALTVPLSGGTVTLGAMAKGSGMIHPDMATLLAVITTDAAVDPPLLQRLLRGAVERSFNRITVDGDTSTNDTVLLLASGASGYAVEAPQDQQRFAAGLEALCVLLAQAIVRDGEGASRFVTVTVRGARDEVSALRVARTVATSPLVKTAFAGGDPNWGRILAAAGRAGVPFDPNRLTLEVRTDPETGPGGNSVPDPGTTPASPAQTAPLCLVREGTPTDFDEDTAAAVFAAAQLTVTLDLGQEPGGPGEATVWTTDLTHDYIRINADYRT